MAELAPIVVAALRVFEDFGYPVIPCSEEKKPLVKDWTNINPISYDEVERLFTSHHAQLVGVRTGQVSGFFVVDVDPEGAPWLAENLANLECKRIHTTRRAGGRHLLYRNPKGFKIKSSSKELAPGIDTRGEGGQVIWWPEHGGTVLEDDEPGEPPQWLLTQLWTHGLLDRGGGYRLNGRLNGLAHTSSPAAVTASPKEGEGSRNQTLTKLAGSMRKAGFSSEAILDALHKENYQRYSPALPSNEVNAIAAQSEKWERGEPQGSPAIALPQRNTLDWENLDGKTPPVREWALEHWLPLKHPSLMAGRGGIGKTLLAQHLATSMAFGRSYIDQVARPLKVLIWAGEDDHDELWRRQIPICAHFGISLSELKERVVIQCYEGADITLAGMSFGGLVPTALLEELTAQVRDYAADYVFLDNIARVYGGNENDRHSVTTFCAWLAAACRPAGICMLGHPAKADKSEYSGSTAWEGAVRARLYLSDRLPDAEPADDDEPPDPEVRYISRRKSNYSANDWRKLGYRDGVLVPEAQGGEIGRSAPHFSGEFARDIVRRAVAKLKAIEFYGNSSLRSQDYLPRLAKQYDLLERMPEKRFAAVMREMIKDAQLGFETVGRYPNRSPKKGLVCR